MIWVNLAGALLIALIVWGFWLSGKEAVKLLYSSSNAMVVNHLCNLMENGGVECRMKNEFLYSAAGEIPPTETWPELWVAEADYARAEAIMAEALSDKSHLAHWQCDKCDEWIEGQFDLCWQCGAPRPSERE